jgi:hypothetical protein
MRRLGILSTCLFNRRFLSVMKTADAIADFGGIYNLAVALGIYPQAIYQWGEYVPELRRYQIEAIKNSKAKP